MNDHKTSTPTLVSALRILAGEIQSADGVANMAIAEGADRIEELVCEIERWRTATAKLRDAAEESGRVANEQAARAAAIEKERDSYREALAARHGGEPIALLSELDEAREKRDELMAMLDRIAREGFGLDDTIGGEPYDAYLLRKIADLRRDRERLDWLLINADPLEAWINTEAICIENRSAIDAAMKEAAR